MAEHQSVSEIEKEAKKLKRDLESWREVILPLYSLLLWDKTTYAGVIFATTSVIFFLLWQINPNALSLISSLGIIITAVDYLVPALTSHICHPDNWTSTKERKLETICTTIAANKILFTNVVKTFIRMRCDRPKCYYTLLLSTLFVLSYIGNVIDNLLLSYLLVTFLLLYPGLQRHGIVENYPVVIYNALKERVGCGDNQKRD